MKHIIVLIALSGCIEATEAVGLDTYEFHCSIRHVCQDVVIEDVITTCTDTDAKQFTHETVVNECGPLMDACAERETATCDVHCDTNDGFPWCRL